MIEYFDLLHDELASVTDQIRVSAVHFAPINQDGRAVSCFTPFHIGYPDRSVQDGDHLQTLCWYAEDYAISKHYRNNTKNLQAIADCKTCHFCLEKASGYYLAISIETDDLKKDNISSLLRPILTNVSKKLNQPLKIISVSNNYTGETWELEMEVKENAI